MGGEKAKPGNGLWRKVHRYPYPPAQCRRHGGGWSVHGRDHREKLERHPLGGEGGKGEAACFCAGIAPGSYPTSQRIKIHRSGVRTGPLVPISAKSAADIGPLPLDLGYSIWK